MFVILNVQLSHSKQSITSNGLHEFMHTYSIRTQIFHTLELKDGEMDGGDTGPVEC